jgi:TPR repeat protein
MKKAALALVLCVVLGAFAWAQMSADDGMEPSALSRLRDQAEVVFDQAREAIRQLSPGDRETAEAQHVRGQSYERGSGVRRNQARAAFWYRLAAEQGHAEAQAYLAFMYQYGLGVASDHAQALSWYRRAADQGNARGQIGLGQMYEEGWGVPRDHAQAAMWYRRAHDAIARLERAGIR